ncbi:MAG TPA: ABC transporter permease subunit [Longimicrobiales bacterium]
MSVGLLLRSEYLKTRKRFAFLVTMLFFGGVSLIGGIASWDASRDAFAKNGKHTFALPEAWSRILGDPAQMSIFFGAILLALLIAQEFPWRTARQNVIDGLSRNQWFVSKVLLLAGISLLFALLALAVPFAFALPATPEGAQLVRLVDLRAIGGYALALFGFASIAFMLSMLIRNPGPVLGVFLLWFAFIERLADMLITKFSDGRLAEVAEYFPAMNFLRMVEGKTWYQAARQAEMAVATKRGQPLPEMPNVELVIALGFIYIVIFFGISYVTYMKRDL